MKPRYVLEHVFAEGAQARLYKAHDRLTGQSCILKTGSQVKQEALLSLRLTHPYLAAPFDFGNETELGNYAAYPEITDPPLLEWIRTGSNPDQVRRVALQITEFLCFLHSRNYLYNDFKPEHFLIGERDIKIIDLGLCTPNEGASFSEFSGTFPYISPERLAGRRHDDRSDLFAFGMLLLHTFFPRQEWGGTPSLSALQQLQQNCDALDPFWKNLLSQMTAMEPSQRIGSAYELWENLLPASASGTHLYFPPADYFSISKELSERPPILFVHSPSEINLDAVVNQALLHYWETDSPTLKVQLEQQGVEQGFARLHNAVLDEPFSDFFSTVDSLEKQPLEKQCLVIFRVPEDMNRHQKALLAYAVSSVSRSDSFRVLITSSAKAFTDLPEDVQKIIQLPLLDKKSAGDILSSILPAPDKMDKVNNKDYTLPEQILSELRSNLPAESFLFWPAVARIFHSHNSVDEVGTLEMRLLGSLAVAGGSIIKSILGDALKLNDLQLENLPGRLELRGYIRQEHDRLFLATSLQTVLERLNRARIKDIAENLLRCFPTDSDPTIRYRLANYAKKKRIAAAIALRAGRRTKGKIAIEWLLNSFSSGARLPKSYLFRLLRSSIVSPNRSQSSKLLTHVLERFKITYRLTDFFIDFEQRTDRLAAAEQRARSAISIANKKNHSKAKAYFSARLAGILINKHRLEEAEQLLNELKHAQNGKRMQGLIHQFQGLAYFYRGQLQQAEEEFQQAVRLPHRLRSHSALSLGITQHKLGKIKSGKRCVERAIRMESRRQDVDRLAIAFNNLAVLLKQEGNIQEARENFYRSIELSRANKNRSVLIAALSNFASTYELEGRTDRAIYYYSKAARAAKALGLKSHYAVALANNGLQYAFRGGFRKAIAALGEAAQLLKELQLNVELGGCYEFLGLTYLFSKHFTKAEYYLKLAKKLFAEAKAAVHEMRALLYLSLIHSEKGELQKRNAIMQQLTQPPNQSFEEGLYHYSRAFHALQSVEQPDVVCRESLHEAERIFRKLPALFWLGKTCKLKAEYFLRSDHYEKASIHLQTAYNIFSRLGARRELLNLSKGRTSVKMPDDFMDRMAQKLPYKILLMIKDVLMEQDPGVMISRILSTALEFSDMERAVLILMEDPPRLFKSMTLEDSVANEIYEISRSAMEAATQSGKPYVSLNASADPYLKGKRSILASRIQSIVCLPLRIQNQILGVLYLDSREGVETLASTETVLLEIFASIIGLALNKTLILERSIAENTQLRTSLGLLQFPEIIGSSEGMLKVLKTVHQLLDTDLPVLITGETGTGKELIARVLHFSSSTRNGSFVAVNCSALSKDLLESELFGHEKGAFTGADTLKKGLFEQARNGTLFLDEIGEMAYSMQAKLLRVLQGGEFRRVGGTETLHTNARIILATNRNLQELTKRGQFREDLYYRIKAVQIHLPPLRERKQDIPLLCAQFLKNAVVASRKQIMGFTPEALELLKRFSWPGNVRQLKNEIERIVALADSDWITPGDLEPEIRESPTAIDEKKKPTLRQKEKQIILDSLLENKWNIVHTARSLGLTRNGLYGKMKMHGISRKHIQ